MRIRAAAAEAKRKRRDVNLASMTLYGAINKSSCPLN